MSNYILKKLSTYELKHLVSHTRSEYEDVDIFWCRSGYLNALNDIVQFCIYDVQSINSESGEWLGFVGIVKHANGSFRYFTVGTDLVEGNEFYEIVSGMVDDKVIPTFSNPINPVTDLNKKQFMENTYQAQIESLEERIVNIQRDLMEKIKSLKAIKDKLALVDNISENEGLDISDTDNISGLHIVNNQFITYRLAQSSTVVDIEDSMDEDHIDSFIGDIHGDVDELRENDPDQYESYVSDIERDYAVNSGEYHLNIPETIITIDINQTNPEDIYKAIYVHSNNRTQLGMSNTPRITPHTVYDLVNEVAHIQCFGSLQNDLVEASALGDFDYLTELIKRSLRSVNITDGAGMWAKPWFDYDMSPPSIGEFNVYQRPEPESEPEVITAFDRDAITNHLIKLINDDRSHISQTTDESVNGQNCYKYHLLDGTIILVPKYMSQTITNNEFRNRLVVADSYPSDYFINEVCIINNINLDSDTYTKHVIERTMYYVVHGIHDDHDPHEIRTVGDGYKIKLRTSGHSFYVEENWRGFSRESLLDLNVLTSYNKINERVVNIAYEQTMRKTNHTFMIQAVYSEDENTTVIDVDLGTEVNATRSVVNPFIT